VSIERGPYRPIFTVLVDGKDFRQLTPEARLALFVLKLTLGVTGICAMPAADEVLSQRTGLSRRKVSLALADLEETKWIEREGAVIWLVRGLEFEPNMSAKDPKHRKAVQAHLASLPALQILERFRAAYPAWFDAAPKGLGSSFEGPSKAHRSTETETETDNETKTKKRKSPPDQPADGSLRGGWPGEFSEILSAIGHFPPPRVGKALKVLVEKTGIDRSREIVQAFAHLAPHQRSDGSFDREVQAHHFCTPERLAATWGFWLGHTEPVLNGSQPPTAGTTSVPSPASS
jgi:hypothetical protein